MGQQGMTRQNRINIKDTTEVICDKCKCNVFQMGIFLRKVSPLLTGNGYPAYIPVPEPTYYCVKCGHVNEEIIPEPLKSGLVS